MLRIFSILFLFISTAAAASQSATGIIYDQEDILKTKPIFLFERQSTTNGALETVIADFKYPDGKAAAHEEVVYESGKLKKYVYQQLQVDEFGTAEIRNGKIFYSFTAQGKNKTDEETLEENTIVSDQIEPTLASHWQEIENGDSIKVRYILVERLDTVGFKFFKNKDIVYKGEPAVEIMMKASSFIIAALAPKITLIVQKNAPHRLLESNGRLPVRVPEIPQPKERKDWRAIDAILSLTYKKP